jgi:nickel/cobalt exporter
MNRYLAVVGAVVAGVLLWPAAPAQAHPLGRFSVNQYAGLTLRTDRVDVDAVVDVAELPTLQDRARADLDGDGTLSAAERDGYAAAECGRLADGFSVTAGGRRLEWEVTSPSYQVVPGTGGLDTSRLACAFGSAAKLGGTVEVLVDNTYRVDRVGWREITAAGNGVRLSGSSVPVESVTGRLSAYPQDLLTSALDVRTATLRVGGEGTPGVDAGQSLAAPGGSGLLAAAQQRVEDAVGGRLTPVVAGLAFLLAVLLGAGHAVLPGHGKTVMAAYFAGRHGRIRDAFAVGGTVTLAHTGAVLVVGLLLSTSTALAGERVLTLLGVSSGVLVVAVGASMLVSARRSRSRHHHDAPHHHSHDSVVDAQHDHRVPESHGHPASVAHHPHGHGHPHNHAHHPHGHGHDHHGTGSGTGGRLRHRLGHDHHGTGSGTGGRLRHRLGHDHHGTGSGTGGRLRHRLGLAGIGLAGGLVPSPSALVVLLGAIGLGRAGLGVALVIAYGLGMAATLTAVGLLLVVAQDRLSRLITGDGWPGRLSDRLSRISGRIAAGAPTATAALVVVVGLGIGLRAVA